MTWLISQVVFYGLEVKRQWSIMYSWEKNIEWWKIFLLKPVLYKLLRKSVGFCFNCLNLCLLGNLPPVGCISVIVEDRGRFLLLKRPNGTLVFPGGFMRWKEHPTETALREIKEETGLRVTLHHVVACYSNTTEGFGSMSTLLLVFCAEVNGGDMRGILAGLRKRIYLGWLIFVTYTCFMIISSIVSNMIHRNIVEHW